MQKMTPQNARVFFLNLDFCAAKCKFVCKKDVVVFYILFICIYTAKNTHCVRI